MSLPETMPYQGSSIPTAPHAQLTNTTRLESDDRYLQQEVRHQKFLFMFDKQEMALARLRTEMARLESKLASLETEVRNSDRARANGTRTLNNRIDALEKMMSNFSSESVASTVSHLQGLETPDRPKLISRRNVKSNHFQRFFSIVGSLVTRIVKILIREDCMEDPC